MDERMRFVIRLKDGESMAALCREFGISSGTDNLRSGSAAWIRTTVQTGRRLSQMILLRMDTRPGA